MDTRREFLKKAALLTGSGGVLGVLPESIQRAFAIDPEPGTTWKDAEHVVILMQENRSFDHCYGTLQGVRGFNDPRAITLPDGNPVWLQTNDRGETYAPFRLNIHDTKATWTGCLPHAWQTQVDARNHGNHDHWLQAKASEHEAYAHLPFTLGHYTRADIPFYYSLADAFTVCDQHFCSSLTGTNPNRVFFWTGTIRGDAPNAPACVENSDIDYGSEVSWKTFPERLEEAGVSWKIYQNELGVRTGFTAEEKSWLSNFEDNALECFSQYRVGFLPAHRKYLNDRAAALPGEIAALEKALASAPEKSESDQKIRRKLTSAKAELQTVEADRVKYSAENYEKLSETEKRLHERAFCTNTGDPAYRELATLRYKDGAVEREMKAPKGDVFHQLRKDVETGQLPLVSWLVAPQYFSDHPDSPWYGAWYVSEALDILTRIPELWKKTIFVLTYDENDGYFDHCPPFVAPHPHQPESGAVSKGIDTTPEYVIPATEKKHRPAWETRESPVGLGFRVPMVIASPWSRGGFVCSQVFDHTSMLQFLEKFVSHKTGREVKETNISLWRRTVSGNLTSAFRPYHGEKIELPKFLERDPFVASIHQAQFRETPAGFHALSAEEIAQFRADPQTSPWLTRQEPGVRQSCALPYELEVEGKLDRAAGAFEITFACKTAAFGEAAAGAPFTVYALRPYRSAGAQIGAGGEWDRLRNWTFAVAAGDRLTYAWPLVDFRTGTYHLRVYGPNGYFREFMGDTNDPALAIRCEDSWVDERLTGSIKVVIDNAAGGVTQVVELHNPIIRDQPTIEEIHPGGGAMAAFGGGDHTWYDVSIRVRGAEGFARRYAGRIETGKPGITDPIMGGKA